VFLAERHNKSIAQVGLRWLTQRGVVVSEEDMNAIAALETKESLFFSYRDPAMVKWISSTKY
jgi:2,5-diketo-D-gluconate reductase A